MPIKKLAFWSLAAAVASASFSNSFFEIFSGIFLGLSLCLVLTEKRSDIFRSWFAAAAGVYLGAVLLTLTQSGYPAESWRGVFRVLRCVLMSLFVVYLVDDEKKFMKVFYAFAGAAFLIGIDALAQGFTGREFLLNRGMTHYTEEVMRITGPFHHANDFAAYLSMAVFLFFGMLPDALRTRSRRMIAWFFFGSALLGACLLWTYSRGAWLAAALVCVLMAVLKRSRFMIVSILAAAALAFILSPDSLKGRVFSLWDSKNGTMIERRILWDEALRMTHERPWLGYGINTYAKIEPQFKAKDIYTDNQYAHNGYLQIAAETGWVGLAAFFAVVVSFFTAVFGAGFHRRAGFFSAAAFSVALGILSFLIHSATDTNLQSLRLVSLFWLAMGMVLAAKKIMEKQPR